MEGKIFLCGKVTPPPISQIRESEESDALNAFVFDLQRFATYTGHTDDTGSDSETRTDGSKYNFKLTIGTTEKYFDYMQSALNYIYTQTEQTHDGTAADPYVATVTLMQDIGDKYGEGFLIGGVVAANNSGKADIANKKVTKLTINLNGYDYIFTKELNSSTTGNGIATEGIRSSKGIQIKPMDGTSVTINGGDGSDGDTTQGTIGVSNQYADRFERIIRSYADFTLNNVILNGSNLGNEQITGEDGAVLCHTKGELNLTGSTSVIAKDSNGKTGSEAYFAVSGKLSADTSNGYDKGYTINVNTTGTITNIGLYKWKNALKADGSVEVKEPTSFENGNLNIENGTIGEITYGDWETPDTTSQGVASAGLTSTNIKQSVSLTGGALGTVESLTAAALTTGYFFANVGSNNYVTNKDGWYGTAGAWNYIVAPTEATANSVGSALATLAGDKKELTLSNATSIAGGINFDANNFGYDISDYNAFTAADVASSVTVVGNEYLKQIVGGGVANSLLAGVAGVTLEGGAGADSLNGASLGGNTYGFNGGADVIKGYAADDIVTLGNDVSAVEDGAAITHDSTKQIFTVNFGEGKTLTFDDTVKASVKDSSSRYAYTYAKDYLAFNKSATLAAGRTDTNFVLGEDFNAVDATKVTVASSLVGNTDANTITASSVIGGNTLDGGAGNDILIGYGTKKATPATGDVFIYSGKGGKDTIEGFAAADQLSVSGNTIKSGSVNRNGDLIFKLDSSSNTITFTGGVEKVALAGDGAASLTKDGTIANNTLTLFADQKGKIDLTDSIYSGVAGINASNVKSGVVTMVGGANGGTFTFGANKKADVFEYGGGSASLIGYVADSDKINLGDSVMTGFTVDDNGVVLNLDGDSSKSISLQGGASKEVLLRDSGNTSYKKYVFAQTGVLYDKAKSPTTATLFNGAGGADSLYTAASSIKKINVSDNVTGISIQASSGNNTFIDASAAGESLTLVSNSKNDKFTGSAKADTFVYTAGKDVITNYENSDTITLDGAYSLGSAKITQSKKSVTLKFDNKNKLTIKAGSGNIGDIKIGDETYTFGKNAIIQNGVASLTSEYSGTYKVGSGVSTVDGSAVTKKNFTIQGTSGAESLVAGGAANKKTTLKGGGGNDSLVGGDSKDTFFYAKSDKGDAQVYNFDYANDQVKMKGTITDITKNSNGLVFTTSNGSLTLKTDSKDNKIGSSNVLIKANNNLYWFEGTGNNYGLYTATDSVSKSAIKTVLRNKDDYSIVDLSYSANLLKKNLAGVSETTVFTSSMAENYKIQK